MLDGAKWVKMFFVKRMTPTIMLHYVLPSIISKTCISKQCGMWKMTANRVRALLRSDMLMVVKNIDWCKLKGAN